MTTKSTSEPVWTRERALTLAALIGCLSIYGITISLFTPLLSLILEARSVSSTLIGGLAMAAPAGIIIGSFAVPWSMRNMEARSLLLGGVAFEILLIFALMSTQSIIAWFAIRFLGGLVGSVLFVVTETWIIEITPRVHHGRVMGFYNTTLALSFALGPLMLSMTGAQGTLPFLAGIGLMVLAGFPLLWAGRYVPNSSDNPGFSVVSFAFVAPLLALACFVVAFKELATTSLMPVYGLRIGMSESSATLMLFFGAAGGALLQFPIGWAADHFNPRKVLVACALAGLAGAAVWPFVVGVPFLLWTTLFLWWGLFAGVYTVAMILAGQWFKGAELATAMAAFGVFWGVGAFVGPMAGGVSMDLWNPYGLPLTLVIVAGLFFLISLFPWFYRLPKIEKVP
ncbi:MAG: MFS transporter [Deltaproteobacteria bacterium]|jgi:MFS family permease|nr:MFS transporter [Deltaproteobacteria bacterium]